MAPAGRHAHAREPADCRRLHQGGAMSNLDLLGGALRVRTRVRGFAEWSPRAESLDRVQQIKHVLMEYSSYLPLTCRQIFYRLVGAHGYEKTERAYGRLCETINRARRARLIDMDDIRDDGGTLLAPLFFKSTEQLV